MNQTCRSKVDVDEAYVEIHLPACLHDSRYVSMTNGEGTMKFRRCLVAMLNKDRWYRDHSVSAPVNSRCDWWNHESVTHGLDYSQCPNEDGSSGEVLEVDWWFDWDVRKRRFDRWKVISSTAFDWSDDRWIENVQRNQVSRDHRRIAKTSLEHRSMRYGVAQTIRSHSLTVTDNRDMHFLWWRTPADGSGC